jgi:hypothetical protein
MRGSFERAWHSNYVHREYPLEYCTQRRRGIARKILDKRVNGDIGWQEGVKRDFSAAQADSFADERGEKGIGLISRRPDILQSRLKDDRLP